MMQDQPENIINQFYKDAILRVKTYIEGKYNHVKCDSSDEEISDICKKLPRYYKDATNFLKLFIDSAGKKITIIVVIPNCFPDHFPKIYLSRQDFQDVYPIPHLDSNRFVCTRDPGVVSINDTCPERALDELIRIAIKIINEGVAKVNQQEFHEEFLAYWNEDPKCRILSIFEPIEEIEHINYYELSDRIFSCKEIIASSDALLTHWLEPFDSGIVKRIRAIYIPLKDSFPTKVKEFIDLYQFFENLKEKKILDILRDYYNSHQQLYIIICSVVINGQKILFGWAHYGWDNVTVNGFRKGHAPLDLILKQSKIKSMELRTISITRLDRMRLMNRIR